LNGFSPTKKDGTQNHEFSFLAFDYLHRVFSIEVLFILRKYAYLTRRI